MATNDTIYTSPSDHLQQGDLFKVGVVLPCADFVSRLFRADDYEHGQAALSGKKGAVVCSELEALESLNGTNIDPARYPRPFEPTAEGELELVVVYARKVNYFMLASQTCDVSGIDKAGCDNAIIVPGRSLREICVTEKLPVERQGKVVQETLHNVLLSDMPKASGELLEAASESDYFYVLQASIEEWKPTLQSQRQFRNVVRSFFNEALGKAGHLCVFKEEAGVPCCVFDLSTIYTVPLASLLSHKHRRIASLKLTYREKFAETLANRIGRVATAVSMNAGKI